MEGENVTLSCNATGIPVPMVSWIKVDGHMTVSNGSELVLTNINRSEAGEYRCEASNECGSASETATIEVQCKLFCLKTVQCSCIYFISDIWFPTPILLLEFFH